MIELSFQNDPGSWEADLTPRTTNQQPSRREQNSDLPRGTPGLSSGGNEVIVPLEDIVIHPSQPTQSPRTTPILRDVEVESFNVPDVPHSASTAHPQYMENEVDSDVIRKDVDLNPDVKPFEFSFQFSDPSPEYFATQEVGDPDENKFTAVEELSERSLPGSAQSTSCQLSPLENEDFDRRIRSAAPSPQMIWEEPDGRNDRLNPPSSEASNCLMEDDHHSLQSLANSLAAHPRPHGLSSVYPQKEKIGPDAESHLYGFDASAVPGDLELLKKQEERKDSWEWNLGSLEEGIVQAFDSEFRCLNVKLLS